jgi:hypothetical protein
MSSKSQKPRARRINWFDRLKSLFQKPEATPPSLNHVLAKAGSRRSGKSSKSSQGAGKPATNVAHMLKALKLVLDRHGASRAVLAHLSVVEQALGHGGLQALEDVPADVLGKALSQLEMLVSDWSEAGIAALRAQIKAAMAKPGRIDVPRGGRPAKQSTDFDNSRMQVNEASVSVFMDAQARWETSLTGGR